MLGLASAVAGAEAPTQQWLLEADAAAASNPAGVCMIGQASRRLVPGGEDRVDPDRYTQSGVLLAGSPAYCRGGMFMEAQPRPFFNLRAQLDQFRYFGAFGALGSYPESSRLFGPSKGSLSHGWAGRMSVQPTFQGKWGSWILRQQNNIAWWRVHGPGPWFYEPDGDTLIRGRDMQDDSQVQALRETVLGTSRLYAGVNWDRQHVDHSGLSRERVGLLVFRESIAANGIGRPRGSLQVGRDMIDPNRRGQLFAEVSFGASVIR